MFLLFHSIFPVFSSVNSSSAFTCWCLHLLAVNSQLTQSLPGSLHCVFRLAASAVYSTSASTFIDMSKCNRNQVEKRKKMIYAKRLSEYEWVMSVWMPFKSLLSLQFSQFSQNLAHIICVPIRKKLWKIFESLILQFLANFSEAMLGQQASSSILGFVA